MKSVKVSKTDWYASTNPAEGRIFCEEGKTYEVSEGFAEVIVDHECGKVVRAKADAKPDTEGKEL